MSDAQLPDEKADESQDLLNSINYFGFNEAQKILQTSADDRWSSEGKHDEETNDNQHEFFAKLDTINLIHSPTNLGQQRATAEFNTVSNHRSPAHSKSLKKTSKNPYLPAAMLKQIDDPIKVDFAKIVR